MAAKLSADIQFIKGVGEKRAKLYNKIGINTVGDLLHYYPRNYINATKSIKAAEVVPGETAVLRLTIASVGAEQHIRKGMSIFKVKAFDETATVIITFFNAKYTVESLEEGSEYLFYGRVNGNFLRKEMSAPMILGRGDFYGMIPVYSLTAGLTSKMINLAVKAALDSALENAADALPPSVRQKHKLCEIEYAVREIHNPDDETALKIARRRLVFEELLILSLGLLKVGSSDEKRKTEKLEAKSLEEFYNILPYKLTEGQLSAIDEIILDMTSGNAMNRLVQGDVGCGKTMVAAAAMYFAFLNGKQSAMMAPTEILAVQHYENIKETLGKLGVKVSILTGSMKAKDKKEIKEALAKGTAHVCVGTHAILTEDVEFKNLALVITDEQHRFGVAQRTNLAQKGVCTHTLVMSATPIPRTLALIVYGDLQVSRITQMPKGRKPVETLKIDSGKRQRAFNFIKSKLDMGNQAYIVCPLIENTGEEHSLKSAVEYAGEIAKRQFADYSVGIIHGKMKAWEKDKIMEQFKTGKIQLLVSTTVIEVGVDVPNAIVMMIENAERFGLSQLHQLRGRVGRGNDESWCILVSDSKNPETQRRLKVLCDTNSGFDVAEEDLKLRGAGDFFGNRQHGLPEFKIASLTGDFDVLQEARKEAEEILSLDPDLQSFENRYLNSKMKSMFAAVGYAPN